MLSMQFLIYKDALYIGIHMDMFLFDFIFSVIFMAAKLDINSDISVVKSVVRFVNFKMFSIYN